MYEMSDYQSGLCLADAVQNPGLPGKPLRISSDSDVNPWQSVVTVPVNMAGLQSSWNNWLIFCAPGFCHWQRPAVNTDILRR